MKHPSSSGFTLIEIIVAMAILGISLVLVMQLFSAGLKSAKATCDYTIAIVHAKDKMEELSESLVSDSGAFEDGFRWETDIQDYKEIEESGYKLKKLKVNILWPEAHKGQKSLGLVSLKIEQGEEKL
ncbi:MAG: prepilin-type N-terminal cleavage/methylation domain-containing protein [Nitrospirae bacterium]|nr:prepilin-type N-terminal cleavage/methylation domain-containing protein [Nitrospirota bacterium]